MTIDFGHSTLTLYPNGEITLYYKLDEGYVEDTLSKEEVAELFEEWRKING